MSITISQNNVNAPAPTYAQLQAIIETQKRSIETERQRNALLENELRWERELFYNPTLDPTDKIIVWQRTPITIKRGLPYDFDAPKQRVPFSSESERIGISSGTYSSRYKRLATDVGMFAISSKREEINGNIVPCVYAVPTQVLVTPTIIDAPKKLGATGATHGGKRVKRCTCGSANLLEKRQIICADCGETYSEPTFHPVNAPDIAENTTLQDEGWTSALVPDIAENTTLQDEGWSSAPAPDITENTTLPQGNLTEKITSLTQGGVQVRNIPDALKMLPQFVTWRYGRLSLITKKREKLPYNARPTANNALAKSNDSSSWTDSATAYSRYVESQGWAMPYSGIGFVPTLDNGLVFLDWDTCGVADSGVWHWTSETAKRQAEACRCYLEVSPSGTGIRGIVSGAIPRNVKLAGIEMYAEKQFITLTGNVIIGCPTGIVDRQSEIDALLIELGIDSTPIPTRETPCVSAYLNPCQFTPEQVLDKARNSKTSASFLALWNGAYDLSRYPSPSEADLALCKELAYWSDCDAEMVDHLFRKSRLYRAEKWERAARVNETYGQGTIHRAIAYVFQSQARRYQGIASSMSSSGVLSSNRNALGALR